MSTVDKTGKGLLLAAINSAISESGVVFGSEELTFGVPVTDSNVGYDLEVQVSVANPEGLSKTVNGVESIVRGSRYVRYNRLDISGLFAAAGIEGVTMQNPEYATIGDVISEINQTYSTQFGAEDFDLDAAAVNAGGIMELVVLDSSYAFSGSIYVQIPAAPIQELPLDELIVDPVLVLEAGSLVEEVQPS